MGSITAHWSWDPSLIYVTVAAVDVRGRRHAPGNAAPEPDARRPSDDRLHELAFAAGLASIVIALDSPIDYYSDQLFWVHMGQHIILLTVAPPLILLGRPWPRMWQSLPLSWRTSAGRHARSARAGRLRIRAIAKPAARVHPVQREYAAVAHSGRLQPDVEPPVDSRLRARFVVLLHRVVVLGPRGGSRAAARIADDWFWRADLRCRRDDLGLGSGDPAGPRLASAVSALRRTC